MINKETISLALKLFIITALSALILAFVNKITVPIIAENSQKSFNESLAEVLPEAENFTEADLSDAIPNGDENQNVTINSLNIGTDADNNCVGYVVSVTDGDGYGGDIEVMIGLSPELKILKAKIMSSSETPGLGAKASEPDFIDQYVGKSGKLSVVKGGAAGDSEISAISGATITSRAVTAAVNAATNLMESKMESGFDAAEVSQAQEIKDKISEETEKQISENPEVPIPNDENTTDSTETKGDEN